MTTLAERIIMWPVKAWIMFWELVFFYPVYWVVSAVEWIGRKQKC
jgi:hypothetical protein